MNKVTIEIDPKWQKILRSPLYYAVATLQGVAITFAPAFLYLSGKAQILRPYEPIIVPLCFAVIFLVPFFYYRLGSAVIKELLKK